MEIIEFTLPDWCAAPLINGDWSGLSDQDDRMLLFFLSGLREEYATIECVDVKNDSGFCHSNDLNRLGDNCSTFVFHATPLQEQDPHEQVGDDY